MGVRVDPSAMKKVERLDAVPNEVKFIPRAKIFHQGAQQFRPDAVIVDDENTKDRSRLRYLQTGTFTHLGS